MSDPGQNVCMGGMAIAQSETLGKIMFSMYRKKQKRRKKYFTPSDLRTIYVTYIRPKMEYNSHLWTGASKSALDFVDRILSRALKLIGDELYHLLGISSQRKLHSTIL